MQDVALLWPPPGLDSYPCPQAVICGRAPLRLPVEEPCHTLAPAGLFFSTQNHTNLLTTFLAVQLVRLALVHLRLLYTKCSVCCWSMHVWPTCYLGQAVWLGLLASHFSMFYLAHPHRCEVGLCMMQSKAHLQEPDQCAQWGSHKLRHGWTTAALYVHDHPYRACIVSLSCWSCWLWLAAGQRMTDAL